MTRAAARRVTRRTKPAARWVRPRGGRGGHGTRWLTANIRPSRGRRTKPGGGRRARIGLRWKCGCARRRCGRTKPAVRRVRPRRTTRRARHALAHCQYPPFPRQADKTRRHGGLGRTGDAAGTARAGSLPISALPAADGQNPAARRDRAVRMTRAGGRRVTRRAGRAGQEYRWKRHNGLTIRGNKWYGYGQSKGGGPAGRRRPQSTRGASSPARAAIHADAAAALRPFAPAGAEKARAVDGSGAYQMADRRRPQSTRGASSPAHAAIHADAAAHSGPSRQRALKKYAPQPMVQAHIKWPAAAVRKARAARPPPRTPPYMPMMLPRTPTLRASGR